jgi:hypothetical protein
LDTISIMYIVPGLHRGPKHNTRAVVLHYGISTVLSIGSELSIRVANTTKKINDTSFQIYDGSFEHEIWNNGEIPWIGLHVPFLH